MGPRIDTIRPHSGEPLKISRRRFITTLTVALLGLGTAAGAAAVNALQTQPGTNPIGEGPGPSRAVPAPTDAAPTAVIKPDTTAAPILPTAQPTQPPELTATPQPTAEPTVQSSPTPRPEVLPDVPEPDKKLVDTAIEQYAKAMGIEPQTVQMSYKEVKDAQGNTFAIATSDNGTPLLIAEKKGKECIWGEATLRKLADTSGKKVGTLITSLGDIPGLNQAELRKIQIAQFNLGMISLYWPGTEATQGRKNFNARTDAATIANRAKMDSLGHLLVWGKDVPKWVKEGNFSREQLIDIVRKRVEDAIIEMTRYGTQSFVVVNEAGDKGDFFWQKIGPEYVDIAFQAARDKSNEIGIPLTLIYNDYANHRPNGARTAHTKSIVDRLQQKGLIDAVGVEMILFYPDIPSKDEIIQTFQSYGIPVIVSEATFNMKNYKGTDKNQKQAQIVFEVASGAIESGNCSTFIVFTPVDENSSWETQPSLPGASPDNDPSLYSLVNGKIIPKPSLFALKKAYMPKN